MRLEASAVTIRCLLLADVFADLLQLEAQGGHGVPTAQKCSPVKFRSLPHKLAIAMALFPFRNPITEATGYFGGIAMHMCTWSGSRCPSMPERSNLFESHWSNQWLT